MESNHPDFWQIRYKSENTPWDLGHATPEFQTLLLKERELFPPGATIFVPGAGRGYDAFEMAKAGLKVTALDFCQYSVEYMRAMAIRNELPMEIIREDFFKLAEYPSFLSFYDLILEYTFFCCIDPVNRSEYVNIAYDLLKPGGKLFALFFPLIPKTDAALPPFPVHKEEIENLFSNKFKVELRDAQSSVTTREGKEFLGIFTKTE